MILGVIPARAGSKGIPNKNLYSLCGKRLIDYTIDEVKKSKIDDFVISTNIETLLNLEKVIKRPDVLCQDDTPMIPVLLDAVKQYESTYSKVVDSVMILQPTSPLRLYIDINKCIDMYEGKSLYSGYYMALKNKYAVYNKHKTDQYFQRNGAVFITDIGLLNDSKLWTIDVQEFVMSKTRSVDIDDMDDMFLAESIIKNGGIGI